MAFLESAVFPNTIAYGGVGGPSFQTSVASGDGGETDRLLLWQKDKGDYDVSLINRSGDETKALLALFHTAKGRLHGFRFPDFEDGEGVGTEEYIGTGDGATLRFQLAKEYDQSPEAYVKPIYKPIDGTVLVFFDGVLQDASLFHGEADCGCIIFYSAPAMDVVIRASFQYHVPVRFDVDQLQIRCVAPDAYSWENCKLLEIKDPFPCNDTDLFVPACIPQVGIQFFGSTGATQLQIPNATALTPLMHLATSLTVITAVSNLSGTGPLFTLSQELGGAETNEPGVRVYLSDDGTVQMQMGVGAANYHALTILGPTRYFCEADATTFADESFAGSVSDPTHLQVYICTFDWENGAVYVSGTTTGYSTIIVPAWNTCTETSSNLTPPNFVGGSTGSYRGRNGGGALQSDGHTPASTDASINQEAVVGGAFHGKMYGITFIFTQTSRTIDDMLTSIHKPYVDFFTAAYGGGTPPSAIGVPATTLLAYCADEHVVIDGTHVNVIDQWGHLTGDNTPLMTNPNPGGANAPQQVTPSPFPPLTDALSVVVP